MATMLMMCKSFDETDLGNVNQILHDRFRGLKALRRYSSVSTATAAEWPPSLLNPSELYSRLEAVPSEPDGLQQILGATAKTNQ
jgi:hypothetical protein